MSTAALAPWCLRFVSGPLRGRALPLKPGPNEVGAGAGCDVLLGGDNVQPRHAVLTAGEWAVALQRVGDAPLRLNGRALEAGRRSVVPGDRIGFGAVELELDRAPAATQEADSLFAPDAAHASHPAGAQEAPPPRRRLGLGLAAVAAVSLAGAGTLGWALQRGAAAAGRPGAADAATFSDINRVLADYAELTLVAAPSGALRVGGFVESRERRLALEAALAPHRTHVALRVHSVDSLLEQARGFLADPGVAVSYAGGGRLALSGATASAATLRRIASLAQDLHPDVLVLNQVTHRPQAAEPAPPGAAAQTPWARWEHELADRVVGLTDNGEGSRYLQLANGQRVYDGALLKSGATLQLGLPAAPADWPGVVTEGPAR